jgi:hypothetical protein
MLSLLVFGIIEYGLWPSAPWRPGRASARWPCQDAVGDFGETTSCDLTGATGDAGYLDLMCLAQGASGATASTPPST